VFSRFSLHTSSSRLFSEQASSFPRLVIAGLLHVVTRESRLSRLEKAAQGSSTNINRPDEPGYLHHREGTMDKIWLYVGGIIVGTAVFVYAVLTIVDSTHPPANDLRAAYQTTK
jgi:hypothetical protein